MAQLTNYVARPSEYILREGSHLNDQELHAFNGCSLWYVHMYYSSMPIYRYRKFEVPISLNGLIYCMISESRYWLIQTIFQYMTTDLPTSENKLILTISEIILNYRYRYSVYKSHWPIRHYWWVCKMCDDLFKIIRHIIWSSEKLFVNIETHDVW